MDEFDKFSAQPFRGMGGIRQQQRPEASGRPRTQLEEAHMSMGSYTNHQNPYDAAHNNPDQRPRPPRKEFPESMRAREARLLHSSQSAHGSQQSEEDSGCGKKKDSAKRIYYRKMTEKRLGKVPYSILSYLAILNAGRPIPVYRIYDFVSEYFPGCMTPGSDSWLNSIRENVARQKELFEKKSFSEGVDPYTGRKRSSHWAIRKHPDTTMFFAQLLRKFLNRRLCEEDMGMANPADWQSILNGTKGIPPVLVDDVEEDDWEPSSKRFRRDEEADRAANALERGEEGYEQNGYDHVNQGLQYANQPYDLCNRMDTGVLNNDYGEVDAYYRSAYEERMLVHRSADVNDILPQQQQLSQVKTESSSSRQSISHRPSHLQSSSASGAQKYIYNPLAREQYLNSDVTDGGNGASI